VTDNGGFTLNGVAASSYGITMRHGPDQPIVPGTKDRAVSVLARAGDYWIDSELGVRAFSLPCFFDRCADAATLDALVRTFAKALTDSYGRPKQLKLVFDDDADKYYLVRYSGQIPFDRKWAGVSDFVLELISDDPYAYEQDEEYDYSTITTSGGSMTVTSSGTVATPARVCVTNNGAAEITNGFTIKIEQEIE